RRDFTMNSPRSTRTSENEREFVSSSRLPPDFVLPSSSTSDHMASTYLPPPPPPRKRVLTTSPHPTASKAKRAIFAIDTQASGEENLDRDRQDGQSVMDGYMRTWPESIPAFGPRDARFNSPQTAAGVSVWTTSRTRLHLQ
ncbi:hypothetical protein PENTCL1PPCAC_28754, partial [Pristionchus entomophagus]